MAKKRSRFLELKNFLLFTHYARLQAVMVGFCLIHVTFRRSLLPLYSR
ncbi:hypothetical protein NDI44_09350 [Trichocoleus sp. DQ-A3]|nr:hypothetical protein [Coleofasciculus sp. FACHB-125]MBD1902960.1 hypothetical protein [Coleofasciculus sp. FACHB-125]